MLSLNSASGVMLPLRGKVFGVGLFFGIEDSKIENFFVDADLRSPLLCSRHPTDTSKPGCVGPDGADVFGVNAYRDITKIGNSVI